MKNSIIALAGLAASAAAQIGSAVVVNSCSYDVYLFNTPAAGGGYSEIDKVLSTGESYTQEWTELTNTDGWSIKLSPSTNLVNIMQYEYTFHDDGTIWFDLSDVNGNPWDGNWEITSSDTSICSPKDVAYRYSTDDAYGMQSCPQAATLTVTLCSGDSDSGTLSSSSAVAASTTSAKVTVTSAATTLATSVVATSAKATTTQAFGGFKYGGPPKKRDMHHHARHPHGHHA